MLQYLYIHFFILHITLISERIFPMNIALSPRTAVLLLALLISARAAGYLFSKFCFVELGPLTVLAYRCLLACLVLLPFMAGRLRRMTAGDVRAGLIIGALFFLTMAAELIGLVTTDTSVASILENTAIVMVPLLTAMFARRLPDGRALVCSLLALGGVVCMSWTGAGLSLSFGEWLLLLAALFYAMSIVATAYLAPSSEPITVGFLQVLTMGVLALAAAFCFESPSVPTMALTYECLLYLAVVSSAFGLTLQPLAQSYCSAETAGILCGLNPLVATVLGITAAGEAFGMLDAAGLVLVLGAIVYYGQKTA